MHLAESLRRIKKNSSKKLADLHSSCAAALVELEKEIPASQVHTNHCRPRIQTTATLPYKSLKAMPASQVQADIRTKIHIIFEPFRLTCDEKNIKVRHCGEGSPCLPRLYTSRVGVS